MQRGQTDNIFSWQAYLRYLADKVCSLARTPDQKFTRHRHKHIKQTNSFQFALGHVRKATHIKVAQPSCGQILANQRSLFTVDKDQLPLYGWTQSLQGNFYQGLIYASIPLDI